MGAPDTAGEDGAVLGIHVDRPAVDFSESGNDAVGGQLLLRHAEVGALGFRQHEFFDEGTGVDEFVDAFAGSELPFGALP